MTGYIDDGGPWRDDKKFSKPSMEDRIRFESQGNLSVQTVILLTSVEMLMEKTNELLIELNRTMTRSLEALNELTIRPHQDPKVDPTV